MFIHLLLAVVVSGNILDPTQKGPSKPVPVKRTNESETEAIRRNFISLKTGERRKLCSTFIESEKYETNQKKIYREKVLSFWKAPAKRTILEVNFSNCRLQATKSQVDSLEYVPLQNF